MAATTLRTILGTKNLTELLSDREAISKAIVDQIDGPTDRWGIEVGDFFSVVYFSVKQPLVIWSKSLRTKPSLEDHWKVLS